MQLSRYLHPKQACAVLFVCSALAFADDQDLRDGQMQLLEDGSLRAWDAGQGTWVEPLQFWLNFAERRGGLTWGRRADYPPYDDVDEYDLLLIELDSGPCLMEFFHRRWRRAQDVRRWDERFNGYGGCADVFR